MTACGGNRGEDPDPAPGPDGRGGGGTANAAGGALSIGGSAAGGATNDGVSAAGSLSDGDSAAGGSHDDGDATAGGSTSNGDGDATAGGSTSNGDGDATAGGSTSDADGDATAGGSQDDADGEIGAGGSTDDGDDDTDEAGGVGGAQSEGGSGGAATSGGSGGVPPSVGAGGTPSNGGVGGLPGSGGSSGEPATGGVGSAGTGGGAVSLDPEFLFTQEEFGGNGRTCVTCHSTQTGTISPEQIQALYADDPDGPLFRPMDSDDGASDNYAQLRERATFRVTLPLPPGVSLKSDPTATSVVLRRGVPTTINSPALDPVIMWDGREPSLTAQALSAILGHSEATVTPTAAQLELIAEFEQGPGFFSSDVLLQYSQGGPAPSWPPGVTAEEQRGRRWFAQDPAAPRFNICGQCHGGPMTNETQANSGLPVGRHFQTANVSEFNTLGNPVYEFVFPDPNDRTKTVTVRTPDPGRALVTGNVRDLNFFKIPTLWGVKNTAPYFHDNSARTLEELMDHYERHLATFLRRNFDYPVPHVPTARDKADIIAYMKLL